AGAGRSGPIAGDGPAARLARTYRFVLAPAADARAAALALAEVPGIESAQAEGRFHALWVTPGTGAAVGARPPSTRTAGQEPTPPAFDPNDAYFVDGTQWGLRNTGAGVFPGTAGADIDAPHGWGITTGSTATRVSIVDTGFDLHHPELVRSFS